MHRHRPLFWLALFLALHGAFLRAFIPAGFMPSFDEGGVRLAFCSPSGAVSSLAEADDAATHAGDECVYALALSVTLTTDAISLELPNASAVASVAERSTAPLAFLRVYSARGPPVLVG